MAGIDIEYWDSCVFLALLKRESHRLGEPEYLQEQARKFDIGTLGIVTSSIALTEILESSLTAEQSAALKQMFVRSNFQFIDANFKVCELASEIRNYYRDNPIRPENLKKIFPSTPDAIHVASALTAQTMLKHPIKLLTFDSEDKPIKNEMALTKMDGLVANKYRLRIGRPELQHQQTSLFLVSGGSDPL